MAEAPAPPLPPVPGSAWAPLRSRVFAVLWTATLIGNIGTWMRDVGAGWLMTTLSASATSVAMVQVATTLPIFLLSLPAGALADSVDRRRVLLGVNLVLALVALGLGLASQHGRITPAGLIAGLLVAGLATALAQPVAQSLTPLTVARTDLRAALALNSLGINVARAIGPALGGLIVASAGVAVAFYVDALSYLAAIAAFWWWKGASARPSADPPERLFAAMRAGLRFAAHAPEFRRTMLRSGSFFAFASAYWSLLPLIARQLLGGGPGYYGLLLASVGAGAVLGALTLPRLRRHLSGEQLLRLGTLLSIAVLLTLAGARDRTLAALAMAVAGFAWIGVLTTANVAAQTRLPNWVRGRGLALYLTVFYGAMAGGSLAWGALADARGIPFALASAAAGGVLALAVALWRPLAEAEPDLSPAMHWPEPLLAARPDDERGPVLVTVEYAVRHGREADFLQDLHAFAAERRRDGAYDWGVYEDLAQPGRFLETFLVASWLEHERQHHRVSHDDAQRQAQLRRHLQPQSAPQVRHCIAAAPPTP